MAKSMQKMLLLAAIETVAGTPAVPVPGTNAILTRNPVFNMIDGEQVERNLMKPYTVEEVVSPEGISIKKTEPTVVRQVISAETSAKVCGVL